MSSTDKRVILVTGANKGIGFEAVRLLSEQLPASTILLGTRTTANGEAALTKLRQGKSSAYSNIHPIAIDVTDKATITAAADEVRSRFGHLDVLLNNAGVSNVDGQSAHQGVFAVNLYGVRDTIEAFLPLLAPASLIVTVSSEVGAWAMNNCSAELQSTLLDPAKLTWSAIDSLAQQSLQPSSPGPSLRPPSARTASAKPSSPPTCARWRCSTRSSRWSSCAPATAPPTSTITRATGRPQREGPA